MLTYGQVLKLEGINLALNNEFDAWRDTYFAFAKKYLETHQFLMGEDIRILWEKKNYPPPHHCNTWGAVWNAVVKRKWVRWSTNKLRSAKIPTLHAHQYRVWESLLYKGGN